MPLTLLKRRIQGQTFQGQLYEHLDLSSMLGFGTKWDGCTFNNCDLNLSDFRSSQIVDCSFFSCDLLGSHFEGGTEIRHTTFERCQMKNSIFVGVSPFDDVSFVDCQLHYASFFDATVKELRFVDCNLHGADLRFIECKKAGFYGDNVLWNASINLGCQNLGNQVHYDERSADLFVGIVSRLHPNEEKRTLLAEIAGEQVAVVARLMTAREDAS